MPQVFGEDQLELMSVSSVWVEAASERDIERATNSQVAAEARLRGLAPLRMGSDPIWHHPPTGMIVSLTPAHTGEEAGYTGMANMLAKLKRQFPTFEESQKAARTPEQIAADQAAAASETKSKKQQAVDAAKRKREQEAVVAFRKDHVPFKNIGEVQRAFDARSDRVKDSRPGDTVEQFAGRLRDLPLAHRQQIHRMVFPEQYPK